MINTIIVIAMVINSSNYEHYSCFVRCSSCWLRPIPRYILCLQQLTMTVQSGMCVSRQNESLLSSINIHQRFHSNGSGCTWAATPRAFRAQVDDNCRKVQWPCQRCAKVTAANRQTMIFKLDNHWFRITSVHWKNGNKLHI